MPEMIECPDEPKMNTGPSMIFRAFPSHSTRMACEAFLDAYAESQGFASRSAAVHKAVRLLRASDLGAAYKQAWSDWDGSIDQDLWDRATDDGLR